MPQPKLLLASSSPYRKQLLERLGLRFETASPDIDETPFKGEAAEELAMRLARQKTDALKAEYSNHIIIGSDQVAALPDGSLLSKPGTHEAAKQQLKRSSGHCVRFFTGLSVLDARNGVRQIHCERFEVHFRQLEDTEIEGYLLKETPYDCAGSFKMEGLGVALFSRLQGDDPNSLIGLPLIALIGMLRQLDINPLTD
ncbi:Maf family protein [Marinobacter sp. VGCF2001]|uniref:Maf family protein n=1 Tax=Marinobacter sp. VGCF2001 TaxID=3417189 RepID=UPI003CF40047